MNHHVKRVCAILFENFGGLGECFIEWSALGIPSNSPVIAHVVKELSSSLCVERTDKGLRVSVDPLVRASLLSRVWGPVLQEGEEAGKTE